MGNKTPPDMEAAAALWFGATAGMRVSGDRDARITIENWFAALEEMRAKLREISATNLVAIKHDAGNQASKERDAAKSLAFRREMKKQLNAIERELHEIRNLPKIERHKQLEALYERYILHSVAIYGKVPGNALAAVDWKAARGALETGSSEPVVLKLEEAFERGHFQASPFADFPIANISGRVGTQDVTAHAELRSDLDTAEAREIMQQLAERLRDPRLGLGPKVQQTVQALMKFWLQSRSKAGFVTVTIQQLAQALGYQRGEHGYHSDVYDQIREYVATAARASLQVKGLPPMAEGTGNPSRLSGAAYTFEYFDEESSEAREAPSKRWTAITFRPGSFLTLAADRTGALLMGFDPAINRLNPRNERGPLLLGKYLERHFRFNWNKSPGRIERRVRTLLAEGMGLPDAEIHKPNIETRNRLEAALDKLEELGTVKHWQGDAQWQTVDDELQPQGGRRRRMTRSLWNVALDSMVTIEAGSKYDKHYIGHGLTYQGDKADPRVRDLRQHIAESGRTQATIASELGVTPSQLSKVLSGARRISPQLGERIDALIQQGKTLPLFGDDQQR